MKKLSKIGLLILALTLICAGIVVSVSGAEGKDGVVSYVDEADNVLEGTFGEAWANAKTDSTIKLLGNCELEEKLYLQGKNLTVDIGNYTLISTDLCAFELLEGTSLKVVGNGKIMLDGMLATSTKENVSFSIEGTAGTKGIDIEHSGVSHNRLVYTEYGTWSFKNLDIVSTAEGKQWHSFFEMKNVANDTYVCDVDFTFDTVHMDYSTTYISHPGQFIVNVAGTGHLTVLNSTFVTEHSGIKSGIANNLGEEVILIKNSLISCVTDRTTIKDQAEGNFTSRNYAILGMNDSFKGSPKGIINIEESHLEANYRVICFENESGDITDNVANINNSTIRVVGLNGNDNTENIARAIILNFTGNSSVINIKKSLVGSTGSKQPYGIANVGTRTNIYDLTTSKSMGDGFRVVESVNEETGEQTLVSSAESQVYKWVYDPIGNPDAPYVLVKRTFETVDGAEVEITTSSLNNPDAHKFAGFETFRFKDITQESYSEYVLWKDKKLNTWTAYEPFGNIAGSGKKTDMDNFQWEMVGGTYMIAGTAQNNYMKFWVDPGTSTAERIKLAGSKSPYWIMGERHASNATDFKNVRTRVAGDSRKAVVVVDIDFGTENGVYPDFNFQFTSRYWDSGSSYGVNAETNGEWFKIRDGGKTITNNLGTTGTNLTAVPTPEFKPANEWNHLSVVFYTDPNYVGGLAYVYLNGELMGTRIYYKTSVAATNMYIEGVRFNINQNDQIANSTLCLDNISLRCYTDYQVAGEADGATKSPESYMVASSPRTYIKEVMSVAGNSYSGASISELQDKAEAAGTVVRLEDDFNGIIEENTKIYTNGYEMNQADGSYVANITYDENTGYSLYDFNERYKEFFVTYYWYIGEYGNAEQMKDLSNYLKTVVTPGLTPEYTGSAIPSVKDIENFVQKIHCGWHSAGDDQTVDNLVPLTLSAVIAQNGKPVYMYPSYSYESPTAYIKDASGVVDISYGDLEASKLLKTLKPGQTFVVCEDFKIDDNQVNATFKADDATYGGGVTHSNSTEKKVIDYTEEQLAAMKAASAKMALDLNGHTISIGHGTRRGSLIFVDSNVTFSVYSSQPGGQISSIQGQASTTGINGLRILGIHNGTSENVEKSFDTYNAHLKVGTVEVDGEVIPGSNLTLVGCVLVEGVIGDNSCSIEVDGIRAVRVAADSGGAFMVRKYSGTMKVTNTEIIAPTVPSVLSAICDPTVDYLSPEMFLENCVIYNNGGGIIEQQGSTSGIACITLKNVITNGNISFTKPTTGKSNVVIDSGVIAKSINTSQARLVFADGVSQAKYNQPMKLSSLTDKGIYEVILPDEIGTTNQIDYEAKRVYIVEAGKEKLVPDGDNVTTLTLPTLAVGTGTASDIVKITFMGLDGSAAQSEDFIKGGLPVAPEISDAQLSAFTKLVYKGEFDKKVTAATVTTVYNPKYDVINTVSGIKASVSFYTSFNLNIYVPYEYKSYFKRASANGVDLDIKDVTVDGVQYVMCSAPVSVDKFASGVKFTLEFDEFVSDVLYSGKTEVTTSVLDYAKTILSDTENKFTASEKTLVYAALCYANEGIKYIQSEENETVDALVAEYADLALESPEDKYAGAVEETNLSAGFLKATVRLDSAPTMVFTLRRNFIGTVKFTIGDEVRTYNISANNQRTIVLEGLSISAFTSDILITVEGHIGGETAVVINDGKFNLATYAKYHEENGTYGENEIATDSQLASKKALAVIDAMYLYADAAKAYVEAQQ